MNIAVVDDSREDAGHLEAFLSRYHQENGLPMQVHTFLSSLEFLESFHGEYDIIYLDIEMPGSNGLEVAHEIQEPG